VEITLTEFDHLISKKKVEENDDVKQLVNHNSKIEYTAIAEGAIRTIQRGVSLQLERRGYFFVDQAASLADRSIKLNFIPDGKSKNMSAISHKLDAKEIAGGKGRADGANRAEAKKLLAGGGLRRPKHQLRARRLQALSARSRPRRTPRSWRRLPARSLVRPPLARLPKTPRWDPQRR
jgi:hypothetical protein